MQFKVIYIMGVSGSGKSTIGKQLSERTGYDFYDADNFHTKENKAKMSAGIPLTDEDRWPWLANINRFVIDKIMVNDIIMVCSALKQSYRDELNKTIEKKCSWIFLRGDYDTINNRLKGRTDHYMPSTLLQSQFDALEVPEDVISVDISHPPEMIVEDIISKLKN
jgi:carbohydrate kinase (thermoresistant glucokinase family)